MCLGAVVTPRRDTVIPEGMGSMPFDQVKTVMAMQVAAAYLMAPSGEPFPEAMLVLDITFLGCTDGDDRHGKRQTLMFVMDPTNGPRVAQAILQASIQAAGCPSLDSRKE